MFIAVEVSRNCTSILLEPS